MTHFHLGLDSCLRLLLPSGLRVGRFNALACLLVLVCACHSARGESSGSSAAATLERRVRKASRTETVRPPLTGELRAAEQLFARTLRGEENVETLRGAWAELHFEFETLESQGDRLWLLRESPAHETGRGFYAFRPAAPMPIALEAPHSFSDEHTRRLAAQLFIDGPFAAAAWNTVHRRVLDWAHTDECFLNAFTRAFLRVHREDATVCQLHGFSRTKRTTYAGRTSDLIVSNGSRSAEFWLQRTAASFREMSPDIAVKLFPDEVSELGATTNRQAEVVRATGVGRFLHLEMSAELRDALVSLPAKQAESLKALEHAFRTE